MKEVPEFMFKDHPEVQGRFERDTCVLVISYYRHLPFLKTCLTSLRKINLYTMLSWDWHPNHLPMKYAGLFDAFFMKHKGVHGTDYPWYWQSMAPLAYLDYFDYILCITGDCFFEKPQGLEIIKAHLIDHDVCAYFYDEGRLGTMVWMARTSSYRRIMKDIMTVNRGGGIGARVMRSIQALNMTVAPTMGEYFDFRLHPGDNDKGYFGEVLGLRHLHQEYYIRTRDGLPPLEEGLIDV